MDWLHEILILMGVALFVSTVSRRLRLPSVVGFLAAGAIAGPYGLGWVSDHEVVEKVAEFGVVFLLFQVGMEITRDRMRELARFLTIGGSLQVAFTWSVLAVILPFLGVSWRLSLFLGAFAALSSTAIVLDQLYRRREIRAAHGKAATGVLLFQDFLIVPLMVLVPMLAGKADGKLGEVLLHTGWGILLIFGAVATGRWLLPLILRELVDSRIRELLVLGALFTCLGAAVLTESMGFSMALGSFLAGILVAESDYRHQIFVEMLPFRDLFQSLFFVSIGMLFYLGNSVESVLTITAGAFGLVVLKIITGTLAIRITGLPWRKALRTGLCIGQIGEFAFVLLLEGFKLGILEEELYQTLLSSSILTMVLTPSLLWLGEIFDPEKESLANASGEADKEKKKGKGAVDVLIAGFGKTGQNLASVLKKGHLRYRVLELDGHLVRKKIDEGEPLLFGDACHPEILLQAGVMQADVLVITLPDPLALRRGIKMARQLNPELYIIARARELDEIENLRKLGANEVVAEIFETSIELVTRVLHRAHVPMNVIRSQARLLRGDSYQMMRSQEQGPMHTKRILEILSEGTTDTYLLDENSPALGHDLIELDLRKRTGVQIIAIVRENRSFPNPVASWKMEVGDVLVLLGSHAQMEKAWKFIEYWGEQPDSEKESADASVT